MLAIGIALVVGGIIGLMLPFAWGWLVEHTRDMEGR